jgi:hypothetical protein
MFAASRAIGEPAHHRSGAFGVILPDGNGRLLFANRTAELILGSKDGLSADAGGLRAASAGETLALRQAVHGAIEASLGLGIGYPGGSLPLSRPSGRRPLSVLVTPIHAASLDRFRLTVAATVSRASAVAFSRASRPRILRWS